MNERAWVKICGLTTSDAVSAAVDAGADAIGFVFAPSRRQVTAQQAATLAQHAPAQVVRIAVMLHPTQAQLDEVCEVFRPDVVQTDAADFDKVKLPSQVQPLPVLRAAANATLDRGELLERLRTIVRTTRSEPASARTKRLPAVLFEGPVSGAGETSDWPLAALLARETDLVLAGGLNAANVRRAITHVHPFGVDVSSGVESGPGVKDPQKIHEFVRNARAGAME